LTRKKRGVLTEFATQIPERIGREHKIELALDISSSCTGWALGVDRELLGFGKLVFKSGSDIGEKLLAFGDWADAMLVHAQPHAVYIEKPLSRRGNVTQRHAELVGILRDRWRRHAGQEIIESWIIPATTVKRVMNVKRGISHSDNKRIMVDKVNQLYGLSLCFSKGSKLQSEDDCADAIAVLTTKWRLNTKGE
jgi:Holliday junction resolvasome RuvABC endonuclease subunit